MSSWIKPSWKAPKNVKGFITTRYGGFSEGNHKSLNLSYDVGDNPANVNKNHLLIRPKLPNLPKLVKQEHGNRIISADAAAQQDIADGLHTATKGVVCSILVADCMPLFLCDFSGNEVGLIHAGWRGIAEGIIEEAIHYFKSTPSNIIAYLGPTIGPTAFEVQKDVKIKIHRNSEILNDAFTAIGDEKWKIDLYKLVKYRLLNLGVKNIYFDNFCTYSDSELFFSYRRDGNCGRMGAYIWIE